jgi:uncharacterized protein
VLALAVPASGAWTAFWRTLLAAFFALSVLLVAAPARALEVPPLAGRVNDHAGLLAAAEAQRIEQKLAAHEQATGQQFALLTVKSLEGDPLEDFSLRVVESWKLGKKGKDDGLLLLIVPNDRKLRIETGYGLEGAIPDAFASRVIRNVLTPAFRQKQYAQGIESTFDALIARAGGSSEGVAEPVAHTRPRGSSAVKWVVLIILFLAFPFLGLLSSLAGAGGFGRRRGGFYGGGFGGGGFGGGGFRGGGGGFSGGGGGFGGGGASGSW